MAGRADAHLGAIAAGHHGLIARRDALRVLSKAAVARRVRSGVWHRVHEGVYRPAGAPETWEQRLLAACWAGGERGVVSHRSAAAIWNLPGSDRELVEITGPRWRRSRHDGVVAHESKHLDERDLTEVNGLVTTRPVRTVVDLAAVLEPRTLEEAVDELLRREGVDVGTLGRCLERLGGTIRAGGAVLAALLEDRLGEPLGASGLETRLLRALRTAGLPKPACQYEIRARGRLLARVDAAYPEHRIAIEADSYRWHGGRGKFELDLARRNRLTAAGWVVVHVTARELDDGAPAALAALRRALPAA